MAKEGWLEEYPQGLGNCPSTEQGREWTDRQLFLELSIRECWSRHHLWLEQ